MKLELESKLHHLQREMDKNIKERQQKNKKLQKKERKMQELEETKQQLQQFILDEIKKKHHKEKFELEVIRKKNRMHNEVQLHHKHQKKQSLQKKEKNINLEETKQQLREFITVELNKKRQKENVELEMFIDMIRTHYEELQAQKDERRRLKEKVRLLDYIRFRTCICIK